VELVFDLEMVNEFAGVLVIDAIAGIEADGMDVACDGGAEAKGSKGVVGLGETEAEHAETSESKEEREEGGPWGGEKDGNGHEGTEGEEDESDPGGDVSGETGAESEAFRKLAWSGWWRRTEFHAGQRGHGSATGGALALPRGVVSVAPAAGDHGDLLLDEEGEGKGEVIRLLA
jgi:hypothetical protein